MAYAVVASVRQTIHDLVTDDSGHICIVENSSRQMLRLVYEELRSLRLVLVRLNKSSSMSKSSSRCWSINRERVNALDAQMREAICELQDILDFHVSHQIHSQIPPDDDGDDEMMIHPFSFTLDFEQLAQPFTSLEQRLLKLKAEYIRELCEQQQEEDNDDDLEQGNEAEEKVKPEEEELEDDDDDDPKKQDDEDDDVEEEEAEQAMNAIPSVTDHHFGGDVNDGASDSDHDMVGLSDTFTRLKERLTEDYRLSRFKWKITAIFGMAGIGKTALAKKLFRDPDITTLFERRAFVSIGQKYKLEHVLLDILKKVNPEKSQLESYAKQKSASFLKRMVRQSLKDRSWLIVLDDLWNKTIFQELKSIIPNNLNNDGHLLVTSRLQGVARYLTSRSAIYRVPFLNKKESWHLLRKKVFGDEESSCPLQLVKAGEKIAENCDGLPLTILKVANILLSTADITLGYWNEVAGKKQRHPVFLDAYEQMFEVLYQSYDYLPQFLKPFFLYIGVFPQNYEIPSTELINLWCGEGLYSRVPFFVMLHLIKLYRRNLVMRLEKSYYNRIKKIGLHSVFWYMCNKEARKNKFFYCLNVYADTLAEDMESQRRLCIQNNVLFAIKDVHDSISSISTVRSLLCTGAYHPYPVPICLGLRLLKVLDTLKIRFYEFPMEALNRFNLKYLSLTLDGKVPSSISKLWNLRYFIVRQHVRIVESRGHSSYLPMEIWNMKELEHLQIMGSDLPNPCEDDRILQRLFVLSDVSARSCTKQVLKRIPSLFKLGVRIELAPDDDERLHFFDDISHVRKLTKLKCIMVTPKIVSGVVAPPAPLSIFSSTLSKLTLSGMGYPWEEMSNISSSLPKLGHLKLRCYAFRGPKWVVADKEFPKLRSLVLEDTDLVKWTSLQDCYSFQNLHKLTIKHCYDLEEIPTTLFGESLQKIHLVDCNPLARSSAEQLQGHMDKQYPTKIRLVLHVSSSWGEGK